MSNQHYCLRWNYHQPNFITVFSSLLSNETLVDVTLAAEGKYLQAHKVVLSACSSYFQDLFSVNPCQHPIVVLKDILFKDLKAVVDYVYNGEVNVAHDQLESVLKAAETLNIKGLANMPIASLQEKNVAEKRSTDPQTSYRRKRLKKHPSGSYGSTPSSSIEEVEVLGPSNLKSSEHSGEIMRTSSSEYSRDGVQNGSQSDYKPNAEIFATISSEENYPVPETNSFVKCEENVGSISVITGIKKRFRLLTRQSHIVSKPDGDENSDIDFPLSPKRPLGRQYSDPTPQQNITSDLSSLSEKCNLLIVPTSHLTKQNSDSALPSQTENKDPLALDDDLKTSLLLQQSRSNHCPMLRPGPALGCNFCWNTIDNHGRILRRKTKYHCPECRTNLCIVPCFQDYHSKKEDLEVENETSKENQKEPSEGSLQQSTLRKHKTPSSSSV